MQKIVVIEQNPNLKLLGKLLSKVEFTSVVLFDDIAAALNWYLENPVDLVLIGCCFPKSVAFDLITQFGWTSNNHNVPIVMLTSSNDENARIHALELGVTEFVSVPVNQTILVNRIKNLMRAYKNQKDYLLAQDRINELQKCEFVNCLTAGTALEFNNILGIILGSNGLNELFLEDLEQLNHEQFNQDIFFQLTEGLSSNSKAINDASLKGKQLVDRMLTYCRREAAVKKYQELNLIQFINNNLDFLREDLSRNITLKTDFSSPTPTIYLRNIDEIHLTQIFLNLFSNAKDGLNGEEGEIAITIDYENVIAINCSCCGLNFDGDFIVIRISDSGNGIDEKILNRIFDPFFTTKEVGSGTGLGLSVIAGLIHRADGYIKVTSQQKCKTTFSLFFPMLQ